MEYFKNIGLSIGVFLKKLFRFLIIPLICIGVIFGVFYALFLFFINDITLRNEDLTIYQFKHLTITFISSCVTTLALVVALLKDEIRSMWSSVKITILPQKPDFLDERTVEKPHRQAEYYFIGLNVFNHGSIHAINCTLILTELIYYSGNTKNYINVSEAEEIKWTGKNQSQITIHANGAKVEAIIAEARKNDAGTVEAAQSNPHKLIIGGIDVTKNTPATINSKWVATFIIYSHANRRPKKYKMEIQWDGQWHERLSEMCHCFKVRELR